MFKWLFSGKAALPRDYRKLLDSDALAIVEKLNRAGLETYLVGGCVRDLLLGLKPKDFDVATKATPQQVKSLVHRSFIIGRRFRIVVAKRRDTPASLSPGENLFPVLQLRPKEKEVQITTFRRDPVEVDGKINENVFGSAEEDAARRDFTLNGLFLEPSSGKIIDFVGGLNDLKKRRLRMIGDPWSRFKEDPIRILRALRFTARANLKFEAQTEAALRDNVASLTEAKKERIREEIIKTFKEGVAFEVFSRFSRYNIWSTFSPAFANHLSKNKDALPHIEAVGRAMTRCEWVHAQQPAPLFYLLFLEFIREGLDPENDAEFAVVLDDFKVSRAEREELLRIRQLLARIQRDGSAQQASRLLSRNLRHYPALAQAFYVLKILGDADLGQHAKLWKSWRGAWTEYVTWVARQNASVMQASSPARSRAPRGGESRGGEFRGGRRGERRPRGEGRVEGRLEGRSEPKAEGRTEVKTEGRSDNGSEAPSDNYDSERSSGRSDSAANDDSLASGDESVAVAATGTRRRSRGSRRSSGRRRTSATATASTTSAGDSSPTGAAVDPAGGRSSGDSSDDG